ENLQEAWKLLKEPDTYVFVAGLEKIASSLDTVMIDAAGSKEAWESLKQQKQDDGRWATLLYN
ncbi:MAG: oxidoreductase, partial [Gammaproteobacteria bacterium]|nr:oxidoreductase [Gammaproteobacteria bacterium]